MELRHLRYFVAVARAGTFTRAAQSLGIQQPPLSQQVRDLERELGYPLFVRRPRGIELTAGGRVFLERAEGILASVEQAIGNARSAAQGSAGSLSLGFTSSTLTHPFAPRLIREYRAAHPDVELAIHEGNAATVSESVAGGRVDVGLIRVPVLERGEIEYHRVIDEPLLLALPADHRLAAAARRSGRLTLRELKDERFILVRRPGAQGMYADLIAACRKVGFAPKVAAEVGQMLTNITLVAAGYGVSVIPASMAGVHADDVVYCTASDAPGLKAPLHLAARVGETNPVVRRFLAFARALAKPKAVRSRSASGARRAGAARRA